MSNELVPGLLENIIKRFDLEFEIAHPKARSFSFEANEIINGVYINYYPVREAKENLDQLFPRR